MVIILSDASDISTDFVIEWMEYYKMEYYRINTSDILSQKVQIKISSIGEILFSIRNIAIDIKKIKVVWNRKFGNFSELREMKELQKRYEYNLSITIRNELNRFRDALFYILDSNRNIVMIDNESESPNKVKQLLIASKVGLKIPPTILSNDLSSLDFEGQKLITKSFCTSYFRESKKGYYVCYTNGVDKNEIKNIPTNILPTLFQNEIKKKYELRIFYFLGDFYSMAIFSQLDNQTQTDFRRYNKSSPNRWVTYSIPYDLKIKLELLMKNLNLKTGSIDIIVDMNMEFYFLEVNPLGQFGMIDHSCNYNITQKIAEKLTKIDSYA